MTKVSVQAKLPLEERARTTAQLRADGLRHWKGEVDGQPDPEGDGGLLAVVAAAIGRVTHKECVHLFNVQPSALPDAIAERDRKGVRLEWLVMLLVAAPDAVKHEIVARINAIAGYKPPERRRELTADEECRIRRRAARRLAPAIADLIDQEVENS